MKYIVLLRGVMPTGMNKIPKMSYLVEILEEAGFEEVKTYIQSGNVILQTSYSKPKVEKIVHDIIREKIGADLKIIVKTKEEIITAINKNPFVKDYELSGVHLTFTNDNVDDDISVDKITKITSKDYGEEKLHIGSQCIYTFLPKEAVKRKLDTVYIEKQLGISATMRKLTVVQRLAEMCED